MYCKACGKQLRSNTLECPYCGQPADKLSGGTGFWDLVQKDGNPAASAAPAASSPPPAPSRPSPVLPILAIVGIVLVLFVQLLTAASLLSVRRAVSGLSSDLGSARTTLSSLEDIEDKLDTVQTQTDGTQLTGITDRLTAIEDRLAEITATPAPQDPSAASGEAASQQETSLADVAARLDQIDAALAALTAEDPAADDSEINEDILQKLDAILAYFESGDSAADAREDAAAVSGYAGTAAESSSTADTGLQTTSPAYPYVTPTPEPSSAPASYSIHN